MSESISDLETALRQRLSDVVSVMTDANSFPEPEIVKFATEVIQVLNNGGRIGFVGNGGSAAEAIHIAAEFTSKCVVDHRPLSGLCLNESQSALTAIANDYGFEVVFSRLVESQMRQGDILVCLSTSGKSANILKAIETALRLGVKPILWTGSQFNLELDCDVWKVPSDSTPRIQEVHLVWGHVLSELVEKHFTL